MYLLSEGSLIDLVLFFFLRVDFFFFFCSSDERRAVQLGRWRREIGELVEGMVVGYRETVSILLLLFI